MEMQDRGFKGVWIPREIWLNEELTLQEKVLLAEIDSLDNENGCFAQNEHFAKFLGVCERRVRTIIKSLIEKNLLKTKYILKPNSNEIAQRILKVNSSCYTQNPLSEVGNESAIGGEQSFQKVGNESAIGGEQSFQKVGNESAEIVIHKEKYNNRNTSISNTRRAAKAAPTPFDFANYPDLPWSAALRQKFLDWLEYKKERREGYKPIGLKNLVAEINRHQATYGEQAVADLMTTCMASGYRGIIWDKLEGGKRNKQPQPQTPPEGFGDMRDYDAEWLERVKAHRDGGGSNAIDNGRDENDGKPFTPQRDRYGGIVL